MKLETYLNAMLIAKVKIELPSKIYDRNLSIKLIRQYLKFRERILRKKTRTFLIYENDNGVDVYPFNEKEI